jgi:hypothetical protein
MESMQSLSGERESAQREAALCHKTEADFLFIERNLPHLNSNAPWASLAHEQEQSRFRCAHQRFPVNLKNGALRPAAMEAAARPSSPNRSAFEVLARSALLELMACEPGSWPSLVHS